MPSSWVLVWWAALTHAGAGAVGLDEWRALCAMQDELCFPFDYPSTPVRIVGGRGGTPGAAMQCAGRERCRDMRQGRHDLGHERRPSRSWA